MNLSTCTVVISVEGVSHFVKPNKCVIVLHFKINLLNSLDACSFFNNINNYYYHWFVCQLAVRQDLIIIDVGKYQCLFVLL